MLTLPYVLALNGWAMGICFMIFAAIAARTTLSMLAHCACEFNLPNYSKIVEKAGGKKLSRLLQVMIIGFLFIASIGYQVIVTAFFRYICH